MSSDDLLHFGSSGSRSKLKPDLFDRLVVSVGETTQKCELSSEVKCLFLKIEWARRVLLEDSEDFSDLQNSSDSISDRLLGLGKDNLSLDAEIFSDVFEVLSDPLCIGLVGDFGS